MQTTPREQQEDRAPARLGVYVDTVYRPEPGTDRVLTNSESFAFLQFVSEVGTHFQRLVLFGRRDPGHAQADHQLDHSAELIELPYYKNVVNGLQVLRAAPATAQAMWRGLDSVDVVWVFGPSPFSPLLVIMALIRKRKLVLGVRQETMKYFRSRLPHPRATPILFPIWILDRFYRLLSKVLPTVVVGRYLEEQYGGPRKGLLATQVSLVRAADVAEGPAELGWSGRIKLLTVGRLEPEKNPFLLIDAIAELDRSSGGRYQLTWVGEGRLLEACRRRASDLSISDSIEFRGYVPFGEELLALYRGAHIFVHVAVTEAMGQVLTEAMACGCPIVATSVGGVPAVLDGGAAGILIPPFDRRALTAAIESLSTDESLRTGCIERGLASARVHTLETEAARAAALIALTVPREDRSTSGSARS